MKRVVLFLAIAILPVCFARSASRSAGDSVVTTSRSSSQSAAASRTQRAAAVDDAAAVPRVQQSRAAVTRKVVSAPSASRDPSPSGAAVAGRSRAAVTSKVAPRAQSSSASTSLRRDSSAAVQSRAAVRSAVAVGHSSARGTGGATASRGRAAVAANRVVGTGISSAYTFCRETYFSCMDEFCANKNAALRRCACSSRMYDFENDKQALELAQSKLTDFQERLLAVNMDKEDAEAMVRATEGELAYNVKDLSASQQALGSILQKINAKTADSKQTQSLAAINLRTSDGLGDVFDNIDSTLGAATTSKEGEALYRAALPICVDMANEVCDQADIPIIQSAYQMSIEQDCNTIAKNYDSLRSTALEKAREGGALLDMSRLTNYQDRNSADIAACTKQMMEVINKDAVCGSDLGKCLDPSGKYIDPMTGAAILTKDLAELSGVLVRPSGAEKWATVVANAPVVRFLDSKRAYIEPAVANCEDIASVVWENFLEEALAKIKIAQNERLEGMRRNCTTVIGECKRGTAQSIQDFDARSLSIFGVFADTTVNKMCADVQDACGALMQQSWIDGESAVGTEWAGGIKDVDLQKTYAAILQNCRIVGQECIRLQCQTRENQFGLCTDTDSSQRRNILSTNSNHCYNEVSACVGQVADEDLRAIRKNNSVDFKEYCGAESTGGEIGACPEEFDSKTVIARSIWGRCNLPITNKDSKITFLAIRGMDTILQWFSGGSGSNNCNTGECPEGRVVVFYPGSGTDDRCDDTGSSVYENCSGEKDLNGGGPSASETESASPGKEIIIIHENGVSVGVNGGFLFNVNKFTNCCYSGKKDTLGNCCQDLDRASDFTIDNLGKSHVKMEWTAAVEGDPPVQGSPGMGGTCLANMCCFETRLPEGNSTDWYPGNERASVPVPDDYCMPSKDDEPIGGWNYVATEGETHLFCSGTLDNRNYGDVGIPETCSGTFVTVTKDGIYSSRLSTNANATERYLNYAYINEDNNMEGDAINHRMLIIYINGKNYSLSAGYEPGWYKVTQGGLEIRCGTNWTNSTECGVPKNHSVAYCENGFKITNPKTAMCCLPSETCKTYKFI
ncbi:MAG: hypothetical protein LBQ49_00105 [Rickettsiales bacterium]|jgi:hypothetical protein|nr:hypothetical protein [Rickettsiales bacterium]